MFPLKGPLTTNYSVLACVIAPQTLRKKCWIKPDDKCLTSVTMQTLLFDDKCICGQRSGNESSTRWVFCGNKQRNVEHFNTCQIKETSQRLTTPGRTYITWKDRAAANIQSTHKSELNYCASDFVRINIMYLILPGEQSRADKGMGVDSHEEVEILYFHRTFIYPDTHLLNYGIHVVVFF